MTSLASLYNTLTQPTDIVLVPLLGRAVDVPGVEVAPCDWCGHMTPPEPLDGCDGACVGCDDHRELCRKCASRERAGVGWR